MFDKLKSFYAVFTAGQSVANPAAWKTGQVTGGMVAALFGSLVALAKVYGYAIPITDDQLAQFGGVVLTVYGLFNSGITAASSDKIGLPSLSSGQSQPNVSEVAIPIPAAVPPVGVAANGDILDGLDTTRAF